MEKVKTNTRLTYQMCPIEEITSNHVDRLYDLMEANYDLMVRSQFEQDLYKKQWVGLLRDQSGVIQGFTTISLNPGGTGTDTYSIIFSGDTIISPEYWGSMELIRGGMTSGGRIAATDPSKKWYWFLMSKGHRTYMYLPLFFKSFVPHPEDAQSAELHGILDQTARRMFGGCWKPDKGLIIFPNSMGQLKPELAESTWQKRNKKAVAYFLEKNPGFHLGHELACLTELSPDNMRGIAQRCFIEGTQNPVTLK